MRNTYHVLIVDDSKLARMSVAKTLGKLRPGWGRTEAASTEDALVVARSRQVDIALVDYNMPGSDGLVLAAELRKIDKDLPLAVVSANSQMEVVSRAREIGASFLGKPLTEEALSTFLDSAEALLARR